MRIQSVLNQSILSKIVEFYKKVDNKTLGLKNISYMNNIYICFNEK
jgi:hypothetical protein